ncbi:unnamed protein product [Heligmosomoides polygyrus]|uniref:Tyrosine-protein phosphatase domain-containing protein n=1 Tax=Heligmosomoides polygyrus TaxID=6339 RepID=A0A183GGA2_HELPZ|nr:unnamed protein product [Heligmosomoides polygyrus]
MMHLLHYEEETLEYSGELLVGESMKGVRIDVHSMKKEQLAITKLGTSSDAVLGHVLTLLQPMQRQLLAIRRKADAHSRPPLLGGSRIVASHLTKIWTIAERPPFKAVNLNDFMERWRAGPRNMEVDQCFRATDFFRRYLQEACESADAIRVYSCRQSGNAGRNPHLKDLPEYIVEALIGAKCASGPWSPTSWFHDRNGEGELGNDSQDSHDGLSQGISVASVEL